MNIISPNTIYHSQGALAVHSGSANERVINNAARAMGLSPRKLKYEALWCADSSKRKSEVDMYISELGVAAELKYQASQGTVDQKGPCELYNAGQTITCDHFVLVMDGPHWQYGRGKKLFDQYKNLAAMMNKHAETFCVAAKKLYVMNNQEYINFLAELKEQK
jgi:hypothetical protein